MTCWRKLKRVQMKLGFEPLKELFFTAQFRDCHVAVYKIVISLHVKGEGVPGNKNFYFIL